MRLALSCECGEIERFLGQYSHFGAPVKDLSRFEALCHKLGDPQDKLRYIHIVGTNGKGSVAEFCASSLAAAGFTAGKFTSPYVRSVCERIAIGYPDGLYEISCADLARLLNKVADAAEQCGGLEFSQFEILNAAAFLFYAEKQVDWVVLEAGIGGTLDSTNVIKQPECAVFTSIGLDHTKILGGTVEEIARSKCGIIKGGNAVAALDIPEPAMDVIRERCAQTGARLITPDRSELEILEKPGLRGSRFRYRGQEYRLNLGGAYQVTNALTAIEALTCAGVTPAHIAMGIERARIPARMELLPGDILLDGGHNPQCIQALVKNIQDYLPGRPLTILTGVLADKDYNCMYRNVEPYAKEFITITPGNPRALNAHDLAAYLSQFGKPVTACDQVADGVRLAVEHAGKDGVVLCYGEPTDDTTELRNKAKRLAATVLGTDPYMDK